MMMERMITIPAGRGICRSLCIVISLVCLLFPTAVLAQVLDEVETRMRPDGGAGIRLRFSVPVQVLRVAPRSSGKTVYVSVRLSGAEAGVRPSSERSSNFNKLDGRLPLSDVVLELNGAEGDRLIINFTRETAFSVFQGKDGRSVLVVVPPEALNQKRKFGADQGKIARDMATARQLLVQEKNVDAIKLFQKIIAAPASEYTQDAHELLGLAYERSGNLKKARAQYRRYLRLYPEGPGTDRVQQRLFNLTGAARKPVLKSSRKRSDRGKLLAYGSLSQRYYTGTNNSDTGSNVDQNLLVTNLDATIRKRTESAEYKGVISADNKYDILNSTSETRLLKGYIEAKSKWHDLSGKLGRQRGRGAGVLDRFDGALVGANIFPKWRLNAVAGVPVDLWANNADRQFSGISLDAGTFAGKWSTTFFMVDSTIDGYQDRQAVGNELRYFSKRGSVFGMVDYDTYFKELNIAMAQANWRTKDDWNYNFLVDVRKAPYLQIGNSLLAPVNGTSYDSISALVAAEPSIDLVALAKDRTASARSVSAGVTLPSLKKLGVKSSFLKKIQLGGDVSFVSNSGLPASAGQPAIEGSDTVAFSVRAIGTKLFRENEISVAGVSLISNTNYRGFATYITDRNRFKRNWRVDAGLKFYYQDNKVGTSLVRLTPSVRLEYRKNKAAFEFELGRESSQSINPLQNENIDRDFVTIGYRYDF